MGYFSDAFGLGAGATLGTLAANRGFDAGAQLAARAFNEATANYRAEYYDPVVRNDLNHLLVLHSLPETGYPFPVETVEAEKPKKRGIHPSLYVLAALLLLQTGWIGAILVLIGCGFWLVKNGPDFLKKHPVFSLLTAGLLPVTILTSFNVIDSTLIMGYLLVWIIAGISVHLGYRKQQVSEISKKMGKTLRKAGKDVIPTEIAKTDLAEYGDQYWHIREYVRLALAKKELSLDDAVERLLRTALVQLFPDTEDEISANVFYFKKELAQQEPAL